MESRSIGLGMVSAGGEHAVPGRLMDVCMWWGCSSACVWMELEELLNCVDLKLLNLLSWIFEQTVWLSRGLPCVPWMNRSAALTQSDQQEVMFNHTNGEQPVTGSTHWNCWGPLQQQRRAAGQMFVEKLSSELLSAAWFCGSSFLCSWMFFGRVWDLLASEARKRVAVVVWRVEAAVV